jgi:hypothetical protein
MMGYKTPNIEGMKIQDPTIAGLLKNHGLEAVSQPHKGAS